MPRPPSLKQLEDVVRRAQEEQYAAPADGSVKETLPLGEIVMQAGQWIVWRTVSNLRKHEPEVYNAYLGERILAQAVIDVVAEAERPLDWDGLVAKLRTRSEGEGIWLVAVPLANLMPSDGYIAIADGVGLGMTIQDREPSRMTGRPFDLFTIFDHLQDRLPAAMRWRSAEQRLGPLDTRRTATLYLVQEGTQNLAVSLALSKARYALALWCLLKPPDGHELHPTLADWEPRPYLENAIERKLFEPGAWTGGSSANGRQVIQYAEYEAPTDPDDLAAPFRALSLIERSAGARAVLAAAWALYLIEREPSDLERSDVLLLLAGAIQALCDLGNGPIKASSNRWGRLTERFGVWRELDGAYDQRELRDAKQLGKDIRNIAAHGADSVLVNLDYPRTAKREFPDGRTIDGGDLALARAAAAIPILLHAVRSAASKVARELIAREFDDVWFASQFDPPNRK